MGTIINLKLCYKCKIEKDYDQYHRDKSRNDGLSYKCKDCCKGRIDLRKNRWKNSSENQKDKARERLNNYRKTIKGKSIDIISSYRRFDYKKGYENNLTQLFVEKSLELPCIYCQDKSSGLDRIDNKIGHTIDNCVPCCKECNIARMDNFTHEEMIILGKTIKEIKAKRISK
jgi:hypothetical protein